MLNSRPFTLSGKPRTNHDVKYKASYMRSHFYQALRQKEQIVKELYYLRAN